MENHVFVSMDPIQHSILTLPNQTLSNATALYLGHGLHYEWTKLNGLDHFLWCCNSDHVWSLGKRTSQMAYPVSIWQLYHYLLEGFDAVHIVYKPHPSISTATFLQAKLALRTRDFVTMECEQELIYFAGRISYPNDWRQTGLYSAPFKLNAVGMINEVHELTENLNLSNEFHQKLKELIEHTYGNSNHITLA